MKRASEKQKAHCRKIAQKGWAAASKRGTEEMRRIAVFLRAQGQTPSMPVVKWLSRPDPFEDKT